MNIVGSTALVMEVKRLVGDNLCGKKFNLLDVEQEDLSNSVETYYIDEENFTKFMAHYPLFQNTGP